MIITRTDNTIKLDNAITTGYSYVHITQKITTLLTTTYDESITEDYSEISISTDGYYIFSVFKLPTTSGAGYYISEDAVYDSEDNEVSSETLLTLYTGDDNILREDYDYLYYNYLNTYYLDLIKAKFMKGICNCNCSSQQERVIIDTLTMGLEVLKTLQEYEQYVEGVRIIEQLSVCSGVVNTNCTCNG